MTQKAVSIVWKVLIYVSNYPFVSQSQDVHLRGVEGGPLPSAQEHSPSSPSPVCSSMWPLTSPVSGAGHGHNLQTQEVAWSSTVVLWYPSPVCSSMWPLTSPVSGTGHGHNLQTQEVAWSSTVVL